jgi:RHS repeat-associated protein
VTASQTLGHDDNLYRGVGCSDIQTAPRLASKEQTRTWGTRLTKTYPDSSQVAYTFDPGGRLTQVVDPSGTYTFGYDNMNRLTSATTNYAFLTIGSKTVSYGYDAASNRKTMTDPQNLPTTYGYDTLNRLMSLAFNGQSPAFGFGYDALSRRTSLTRPNSVNTTYAYDPVSRLTSVLHKLGTTTLDGATYTYDNAGIRQTRTDKRLGTTLTYGYDNIYQLLSAKQGSTTKETYTYDLVGNRLSSLGVSPYTYNSSNELTGIPGLTYGYDNNGNTKTKSDGTTYTWDFENRLTQVVLPGTGGTVNFKYDPVGRRAQKSFTQNSTTTTTNYLYDGHNLLEQVDNSGNVLARYTQGKSLDEPLAQLRAGNTSYYEADGLGTITSLSNGVGALANTYSYDSYGKLTASSGSLTNPFQYTARELDSETGIIEYRARYFDQNIGRFISEDPIAFRSGPDFYAYVRNSPVNFIDPFGWTSSCPLFGACSSRRHPVPKKLPGLPRPDPPPTLPSPVESAYESFMRCLQRADSECEIEIPDLPKFEPPKEGSGGNPGPADFGVSPNEGTITLPNYSVDHLVHRECDCIVANPLATLDKRYSYDLSPECATSF